MLMLQNVQFFNTKDKKYVFSYLLMLLYAKKTLVTALRILSCNFRDEFSKETFCVAKSLFVSFLKKLLSFILTTYG